MDHTELLARRDGIQKIIEPHLPRYASKLGLARERANNIAAALQDGEGEPFGAAYEMLARAIPDDDLRRKVAEQIETYWYAKEGVKP